MSAVLLTTFLTGSAYGGSLMSASTITPPSIMDNDGLIAPSNGAPSALFSPAPAQPSCSTAPTPLSIVPPAEPDGCAPAPMDADLSFGWQWSYGIPLYQGWGTPASNDLQSVNALMSVVGPLAMWTATRSSDPSMNLADWSHVFNVARIGVFEIPLRSDPAERTNILLSAEAVDGTMLQPGDVFSFNDIVGERTADRGYQDGWMFDQGKLIRGTGGGICLVATGLYNAALNAGLGLVERHPHSGLVRYAPPGCDAAVVYGSEDLKFENTTSSPILVRAIAEDDRVVVGLFGAPPPAGYKVVVKPKTFAWLPWHTIEKPDPTLQPGETVVDQQPHSGYTVTLERVILQGDAVVRQEVVSSDTHHAVDKIVRVPISDDDLDSFLAATFGLSS
jgi:hypothetical protein